MIEAYPLHWPIGYKRTTRREQSRFKQTMDGAQRFLRDELSRLGASSLVISTNIPVRNDGHMYAAYMSKRIDDPGVAIYFKLRGKDMTMCCDKFERVWENAYSLGKGIEALRGMDRWGVSEFLERAFTGFTALPESTTVERNIWDILGLSVKPADLNDVHAAYRSRAKVAHPDADGGSTEAFQDLRNAYDKALRFYVSGS